VVLDESWTAFYTTHDKLAQKSEARHALSAQVKEDSQSSARKRGGPQKIERGMS
jgi:hypothetical protein